MSASPDEIEQALASKIAKSIQTSPEDALLGFLDVDEDTQQAVLQFLRDRPGFVPINQYLRRYPALTSYGLAVAAPIGLQDDDVGAGAIYGAWQAAFGFSPSQSEREPLARDFVLALDHLGLQAGTISPDHDLHWMGGCYLFHGAILPHFVEPLRRALESVQKSRPLPDPEDVDRAASFATILADKVHISQTRLRKTLQSSVGSFLVRRLSQWLATKDGSLFPAHIQPLLKEQQQRGVFLQAPCIQFDETEGQMLLVLPAQTSSVADSNTRWIVGGREYRASSELPPIPLEDLNLDDRPFDVTLAHLKDGRENCTYHLQGGIPTDRGFRIFDARTGKERKLGVSGNHTIELSPGQTYLVVLSESANVESDHEEEDAGDFRCLRVGATPGDAPVFIENEGVRWTLKTKVRPGLYITPLDECRFRATRLIDGASLSISYGRSPELTCAIPLDCETPAKLHFSTKLNPHLCASFECPSGVIRDGVRLVSGGQLLGQWMDTLPAAVHVITITLECHGRSMNQELIHWKGLEHITIYGAFHCGSLPANLVSNTGFEKRGNSLQRPKVKGGKAELGFSDLGRWETERWEVPANRVDITVVDLNEGLSELDEGGSIEVLPSDHRSIQFRSGGLLPIRLTCNGRELGVISAEKPLVSKFLTAIAAEHGRTGTLKAEALIDLPGERSWTALNWRTPQTAQECRQEPTDGTQVIWLIRKVSITGVADLRIKLHDFAAKVEGKDAEADIPLSIPDTVEATSEVSLGGGFSCSVRRKPDNLVQIRLCFDRAEMRGSVWVTDLECRLSDSAVWQPIMSREAHGRLAMIRLVFIGGTPEPGESSGPLADLFWGRPTDPLPANSPARKLGGIQIERWLDCVQWLLACKYPTPVWHQNGQRFKSLYQRLSSICLFQGDNERCIWWMHAASELQRHAREVQPVIVPCLLFTSNLKMASTSLKDCDLVSLASLGSVGRAFHEASRYQSRNESHALGYISSACSEQRLSWDFLQHFSRWHQLLANHPVKLGDFQYRDWSNKLAEHCKKMELGCDGDGSELMSAAHFVACLTKAKRRADVLLSVSQQDYGHWLSGPISMLRNSCDGAQAAITSILGHRLSGVPAEVFLRPLTQTDLLVGNPDRRELMQSLMMASCLLALVTRAKSAGIISTSQLETHLRALLSPHAHGDHDEDAVHTQTALVLGTAPELFSFYFLLFTLSLHPAQ